MVARGELVYVVLNLYPYNPGHSMVVPYRRVSELEDLTDEESAELMAFTQKVIRVIKAVSQPARLQRRAEPRQVGGRLAGRAPAHARGAAVERRRELHHDHRRLQGRPAAAARDPRAAGHGMGEAAVSDFYLMTRAAYAKLSTPVAKAALRAGFTPDSITILGTAGTVLAALTLFPIGQLWWGAFAVFVFVLADMLDGAMARERGGGTRFGAVLDATCDRIGDGAMFCGLLWWAAFGLQSTSLVVATMICLVTSQVISYIKARAEASGLSRRGRPHRATGTADHRAGRRGAVRRAVPPHAVAAARRDVGARGGQPDHPGAAGAHRADLAGRDGAADAAPTPPTATNPRRGGTTRPRAGGASHDSTPAGQQTDRGGRFPFGGQLTDLGYAAGWRAGPRDAGVRGAQRF